MEKAIAFCFTIMPAAPILTEIVIFAPIRDALGRFLHIAGRFGAVERRTCSRPQPGRIKYPAAAKRQELAASVLGFLKIANLRGCLTRGLGKIKKVMAAEVTAVLPFLAVPIADRWR